MSRKGFLLFLLVASLSLLALSCRGQELEAKEGMLKKSISSIDGALTETAEFSVLASDGDGFLLFRLSSPGGLLSWEGSLERSGNLAVSDSLLLTEGASFPVGLYTYTIWSDNGGEAKGEARMSATPPLLGFDETDADVAFLDEDMQETNEEEAVWASFSYLDSSFNSVSVLERL